MLLGHAGAFAAPGEEPARTNPAGVPSVAASKAALAQLLDRGESAEKRRGGTVAVAAREYDVASAEIVDAWLAWLPDFSLALRRQYDSTASGNVFAPRFRIDVEGQAAFSLQKFAAASVARAARTKAQADVAQARHLARQATLFQVMDLYLAERRALSIRDQIADFEHLTSSLAGARGEGDSDAVLLGGRLAELRGDLAELERKRRDAAGELAAALDTNIEETGIAPKLELRDLLELIRSAMQDAPSKADDVLRAQVNLERERLRSAASQAWYQPQLRANGVAQFPKSDPGDVNGDRFRLAGITAEFSLGLRIKPGVPSLEGAAEQAIARSGFESSQSGWQRGQLADRARVVRDTLSQLWAEQLGVPAARTSYADATQRFMRGERSASDVSAASRRLLEVELERDAILQQVLTAQIVLASDAAAASPAQREGRAPITLAEANERCLRAADDAAMVKTALAEARRARLRARGETYPVQTSLDAGVSVPVYRNDSLNLESRPLLAFAGTSTLTTPVREVSALGRWSVDVRSMGPTARALNSEAELRVAEAEFARKRFLWGTLEARLELAHARAELEVAERAVALALRRVELERRWLQQGAASDEDVRAAELAQRAALLAHGRAEAREHAAALLVGSYLGAPRGTELRIDETPRAVEAWAREHLFPEQNLSGFQATFERRIAELEVQATRARAEALARPPRTTTFAAQATQGLHGGAFSLTLAVSVALDPLRDPPQAARAARFEGAARGRLVALDRELNERRVRATERAATASKALEAERLNANQLARLDASLRADQAALPGVHEAVKERGQTALETARLESERRRLDAEERLRRASLEALALDAPAAAATPLPRARDQSLTAALASMRDEHRDVIVADAIAHDVSARSGALPVASALHLVGPFSVGSYLATRVTGPSTTKMLQADQGVGLALALDEAASFGSLVKLRQSAQLEQKAARRQTELAAVSELARAWTARELERLSRNEEAAANRYIDESVAPRFALGQVTPALLAGAELERTNARVGHAADQSSLEAIRRTLAAQGVTLDDSLLDEYGRKASVLLRSDPTAAREATSHDPAELAARARSAAATYDVVASGLRILSPITGLLEFRPAHIDVSSGTGDARVTSTDRELLWVLSLLVPVRFQAIGRLSVDLARARLSEEQVAAVSRRARNERLGRARELSLAQTARAAAVERREDVERAYNELERRFRNQERRTSIDDVARARKTLFEAQRAEILATGALLEAAWSREAAGAE